MPSPFILDGEFVVPTIFLTNGGNALRASKAASLSSILGVDIKEDQVHYASKIVNEFELIKFVSSDIL